jgi:hypothetical protein
MGLLGCHASSPTASMYSTGWTGSTMGSVGGVGMVMRLSLKKGQRGRGDIT